MFLAARSRLTHRAAAILAVGVLAACGSSRKVAEGEALCVRCHGDAARVAPATITDADAIRLFRAAPPRSVDGKTAVADVQVGAHQAHLVAGRLRGPIACGECHVVPADMTQHQAEIAKIAAGTAQAVVFGPFASRDGGGPAFDEGTTRCSGTYCHGSTLDRGGSNHLPQWNAGVSEATCSSCHGDPPANTHTPTASFSNCASCHGATTSDNFTINVDPINGASTHMNGKLDVSGLICSGTCTTCHGAPAGYSKPLSGAHLAHVTSTATDYGRDTMTADTLTTAATTYDFGCGNCHSTNCDDHASGRLVLSPLNATAGSLKARNALTASYNATDQTCAGVYCHSSGQATPAFVQSPAWNSATPLGCGGCHANPPDYANGGAGTAMANSHIALVNEADLTYETGHFGGFPAAIHDGSFHGRTFDDSSPITCQTCHYDSVDGGNTGPSGFYYLDTSGNYDLGGSGSFNVATIRTSYACVDCHTGFPAPAAQGGRARPYYHVDGSRNVVFDRRTDFSTATGTPILPAAPNTPTRPYWYTRATTNNIGGGTSPAMAVIGTGDAVLDGTTISMSLGTAAWNAASQTCSSVVCHFARMAPASQPLRWGQFGLPPDPYNATLDGGAVCTTCHSM